MKTRLAIMDDLPEIKNMYGEIVRNMMSNDIDIWDEIYPSEFFEDDIIYQQLYVLINNINEIVAAFVLCQENAGENAVTWQENNAKPCYIDRFGVSVKHSRKGIGTIALNEAIRLSKEMKVEYLRLFVVDNNYPAVNLYQKMGFKRADGVYIEFIDDEISFDEIGYEMKL